MIRFSLLSLTFFMALMSNVESHGGLISPRSRNEVAREEGTNVASPGLPVKEYCWHCLNRNNGICGKVDGNDYDEWLDSSGNPMPWKPEAIYQRGEMINIETEITAHHWGHIELRACPNGRQSTQSCLDSHPLEFVQDVNYAMPQDPKFPDRGYLADRYRSYNMKFRLPSNLVGDQVLLQWRYITSNSCLPPGYVDYYTNIPNDVGRSNLRLRECSLPYSNDGLGYPEQFWNCAEISVIDGSGGSTLPRTPVKAPTKVTTPVVAPTQSPSASPEKRAVEFPDSVSDKGCCSFDFKNCITNSYWCGTTKSDCLSCESKMNWLPSGALDDQSCAARYQTCTDQACCPGLICEYKNAFYSQCNAP